MTVMMHDRQSRMNRSVPASKIGFDETTFVLVLYASSSLTRIVQYDEGNFLPDSSLISPASGLAGSNSRPFRLPSDPLTLASSRLTI